MLDFNNLQKASKLECINPGYSSTECSFKDFILSSINFLFLKSDNWYNYCLKWINKVSYCDKKLVHIHNLCTYQFYIAGNTTRIENLYRRLGNLFYFYYLIFFGTMMLKSWENVLENHIVHISSWKHLAPCSPS